MNILPELHRINAAAHAATVHPSSLVWPERFDQDELDDVFADAEAAGAEVLVTTEKDAVRIEPGVKSPMPFYYLRVEIEIISGAADFEEAVSRISRTERIS